MTTRRRRPLTPGERRLWAEILRSVEPLPGRTRPPAEAAPEGRTPPPPTEEPRGQPPLPGRSPPVAPRLVPLERRTARKLSRGQMRADASLDLHGMTQAAAHRALVRFLRHAQAQGHTIVMVVTGKGRPGEHMQAGERGILRRMVPLWLGSAELKGIVLGLDQAGPRQGGEGALYVRLRRSRTEA